MLELVEAQSAVVGMPTRLLADTRYCSEKNIVACADANVTPLIAVARDQYHPDWRERHSEPAPLSAGAGVVQTMAHTLKTKAGRAQYALLKHTIEAVFGIKSVMGFRPFSLRDLELISGEWSLVCLA